MSVLRVEADSLILSDPSQSRSTVHVGISHPAQTEEQLFGKLYLIVEIDSTDRSNHDIINALQEELRTTYYQSSNLTPEQAFEAALKRGNERLHQFITEGVTDWVDRFNAIVAVVKNGYLSFVQIGNVHTFLFSGNRITDIANSAGAPNEKRNPLKLFSTVVSGHLKANDRVLMCTSSLLDFFSQEKLKRLIIEDLPSATVAKIEQNLLTHTTPTAFAAMFFAFLAEDQILAAAERSSTPSAPIRQQSAPERSMEELISKERTTEQLLSPSVMPNVKSFITSAASRLGSFVRSSILQRPPQRRLSPQYHQQRETAPKPFRHQGTTLRTFKRVSVTMLIWIISIPRLVVQLFGYRKKVTSSVRQLPERTTGRANRFVLWIRSLTPLQQIIMIAALVALFILSESIVSISNNSHQTTSTTDTTTVISTIQDNVSKAEAALTYNDYDGAIKLINDSQALLNTLPNKTKKDKQTRTDLIAKIAAARVLTRRIQNPTPATVADLSSALSSAVPTSIAVVGSTAIIATNTPNTLFTVNIANGTVAMVAGNTKTTTFAVPLDATTALLGTTENAIQTFSTTSKKANDVTIQFANVDRSIIAAALFQSRLYLLDTKNEAVLRSNVGGTTFGPATSWLKQQYTELKDATSLAVDGSIYLSLSNGTIERFTSGLKDDVTFDAIDPALTSPTQLWTATGSTKLYMLEPAQKRIVVYLKSTRKLQAQYVADSLGDAVGFSVDEKNKVIYVLTHHDLQKFTVTP